MSATDIVLEFIAAFERLGIPYMLVGSYSSNVYGRPRSTNFALSDDAHDCQRFERRQRKDFEGTPVWFPTPEDVIVTKLRWSKSGQRAKDVDDVRNVLKLRADDLDLAYIRRWCDLHGTRVLFEKMLGQVRG